MCFSSTLQDRRVLNNFIIQSLMRNSHHQLMPRSGFVVLLMQGYIYSVPPGHLAFHVNAGDCVEMPLEVTTWCLGTKPEGINFAHRSCLGGIPTDDTQGPSTKITCIMQSQEKLDQEVGCLVSDSI